MMTQVLFGLYFIACGQKLTFSVFEKSIRIPQYSIMLTQVLLAASYAKAMLKVLMMLNLNLPQTQGKVHYAHCFKVFCTTSQRSMQSR